MKNVSLPEYWEQAYQEGRTRWDLGTPHPVFKRLLQSNQYSPGKMIVLGAGRGHDARMFAAANFTVTAVDFAEEAAQYMRTVNNVANPVNVQQADIFTLPETLNDSFDYLLEYTCYCAIDPRRRPDYADLVARLLKPGGTCLFLLFPIWENEGGPPFAVTSTELLDLFLPRGFVVENQEAQPADSLSPRRAHEALFVFRKI